VIPRAAELLADLPRSCTQWLAGDARRHTRMQMGRSLFGRGPAVPEGQTHSSFMVHRTEVNAPTCNVFVQHNSERKKRLHQTGCHRFGYAHAMSDFYLFMWRSLKSEVNMKRSDKSSIAMNAWPHHMPCICIYTITNSGRWQSVIVTAS
jgi:hypothetical protein